MQEKESHMKAEAKIWVERKYIVVFSEDCFALPALSQIISFSQSFLA